MGERPLAASCQLEAVFDLEEAEDFQQRSQLLTFIVGKTKELFFAI